MDINYKTLYKELLKENKEYFNILNGSNNEFMEFLRWNRTLKSGEQYLLGRLSKQNKEIEKLHKQIAELTTIKKAFEIYMTIKEVEEWVLEICLYQKKI